MQGWGRKPVRSDEEPAAAIREVPGEAEALGFRGEGYRKVWARLRHKGIPVSKERVRRLMREHGLQAPHRAGTARGPRVHDGTIIPDGPNRMWGTDATQVHTRLEGMATVFVAVDHFVGDVVGMELWSDLVYGMIRRRSCCRRSRCSLRLRL